MKDFIRKLNIAPSWVIFLLDIACVILSSILALLLRDNFQIPANFDHYEYYSIPLAIIIVRILFFGIFRTNTMIVRYTNTNDIARIFFCCFSATAFLGVANLVLFFIHGRFLVPVSILIVEFFITTFILIFYRLAFKILYLETANVSKLTKNIVIFGAGIAGMTTKRALDRDVGNKYKVLAFIDDDPAKIGKKIENLIVISSQTMEQYFVKNDISFLIIAIQNLPAERKNEVTEICLQYNIKVLVVPPVSRWINGELSFKQIKKVKIEELLERDPIVLDESLVNKDLEDKTILITGAAGSIGSEIVRQVMNFNYRKLILVDNAETPMFYLQSDCLSKNNFKNTVVYLADICDAVKMESLFSAYKPDIVYHAAAYKHVPLMESNANAAVKVNVMGTKILADLAVKYETGKFVMVSTDKAVNPSNVMGASKRIAEIYVQSFSAYQNQTKFITTRFGNVLGSNGSVIPVFRQQIENGGPVQVTHPEITRYFMTIPEACQLVLNAGAMGNGGEIFIFDMGESVKIYDLAVKMIRLSGLTPGKDISIEFSGLRPGEKLYEELLANQENTIKTDHQKIMVAKVRTYQYTEVASEIAELIGLSNSDVFTIVQKMKEIVPEFVSKNSEFETSNRDAE